MRIYNVLVNCPRDQSSIEDSNELLQHDPDELSAFAADVVLRGAARLAGPVLDVAGTGQ